MPPRTTSTTRASSASSSSSPALTAPRKKVCFVHLDLGIGGAEQLIVHAARGLASKNHDVVIYTSFFDPNRCFPGLRLKTGPEDKSSPGGNVPGGAAEKKSPTVPVVLVGTFLPRSICGRFIILCSVLRMIWISLCVPWSEEFEVIVNDQVSVVNPYLRWVARSKLLFYCHHPDLLLSTNRSSSLMRFYRWPFDWLEEKTTALCEVLCVNSVYTAEVFRETFASLRGFQFQVDEEEGTPPSRQPGTENRTSGAEAGRRVRARNRRSSSATTAGTAGGTPGERGESLSGTGDVARTNDTGKPQQELHVLYPPADLREVDAFLVEEQAHPQTMRDDVLQLLAEYIAKSNAQLDSDAATAMARSLVQGRPFFCSLNRYERKKEIHLALEALGQLDALVGTPPNGLRGENTPILVIAGGYDPRVSENVEYFAELRAKLFLPRGSTPRILFLRSVPNKLRLWLLRNTIACVYTPFNEHFGMVPIEAMALHTLVIASNSGGPRESVAEVGGFLVEHSGEGFARGMKNVLDLEAEAKEALQNTARKRVEEKFSLESFVARMEKLVA